MTGICDHLDYSQEYYILQPGKFYGMVCTIDGPDAVDEELGYVNVQVKDADREIFVDAQYLLPAYKNPPAGS